MRPKATGGLKFLSALAVACLLLCVLALYAFAPRRSRAAAQTQSRTTDCPQLSSDIVATEWIGRTVHHTLSARLTGGTLPARELTYRWKVSPGKITGGQGTHSITVEMPECECDVYVETEVEGLEHGCEKIVRWGINDLCFYPVSVDSYGDLAPSKEKALLAKYAPLLKKGQCWQMRITAHGEKGEPPDETLARAKQAKHYIVSEHGVEADRISVAEGGPQSEQKISLLIFHGRFMHKEVSRP